jgi:large subunit ribosomal protein L22
MEAQAHLKYLRISPRKVGIVLDLIRNKPVGLAIGILQHTPKSASWHLLRLLNSAISNAVNVHNMQASELFISECFACPGPTLKRVQPVSKGRGHRILKRSSHVTIVLTDFKEEESNGAEDKS